MERRWKSKAMSDILAHKVCSEYEELLSRADSKVGALSLYKRGVDWCLENNSPDIDLLRLYKADCEASGIFIDKHFAGELLNDMMTYVFHNCTGTIRVGLNLEKKIIPMLYFANGCRMEVKGDSPVLVRVPFYVFGNNEIVADPSGAIEAKFYRR